MSREKEKVFFYLLSSDVLYIVTCYLPADYITNQISSAANISEAGSRFKIVVEANHKPLQPRLNSRQNKKNDSSRSKELSPSSR